MFRHLIVCAVFCAAVYSPALGQTSVTPDSTLQLILNQTAGSRIILDHAIQEALDKATSVRSAEATYLAARGAARREGGMFDPVLFYSVNYLDQTQPTASFFSGAPVLNTVQVTNAAGLRWQSPIGTNIIASLNAVRQTTNSAFASLNPQYTTFGAISLRQSLLGGFHLSARKLLSKADSEEDAAKARYDQAVLGISTLVEQAYWDLYAVERDYAVQMLLRERAAAFLKDTQLRAVSGLVGPDQVASARTFLAEQEVLLLDREEQLDHTSDQFASLIGIRPAERRYLTVDTPAGDFALTDDADLLVRKAVDNNLDLKAAGSDLEAKRALSRAAGWEALPKIDLVGSLGGNGLGGAGQTIIFGTDTLAPPISQSFNDAISQVTRRAYPTWSVGLEFSVPIGLRSGLGERDRLDEETAVAEQRYVQQSRLLEEQVRASYRELFNGKRRLVAAREGVEAAQEQVRIGLIEFENGRTTAFELVRLGTDFAAAQQRYSQALVRSAKAASALKQLTSGAYPGPGSR
jgi:outer membrane protein